MELFILTTEQVEKARTYISLADKTAFCEENAQMCLDRLQIKVNDEEMPPMYKENVARKQRFLMTALCRLYLGVPFDTVVADGKETALATEDSFDWMGESHIYMQLERMKRDSAVKNKVYDLMNDYYQLDKMFSAEIRGLIEVQNDTVLRQQQLMSASMSELPRLLEQLKELQAQKG